MSSPPAKYSNTTLSALTAAALALPGLLPATVACAEADTASFQYGRYEEGSRQLFGVHSYFKPITVDSLQGNATIPWRDRLKFIVHYAQDTWSGATPIATAPLAFGGNAVLKSRPGIVTGASPLIDGSGSGTLLWDAQHRPYYRDPISRQVRQDPRQVHTLSAASPETRKQGDFKLHYDWDNAALEGGGGLSLENDYTSRFVNLNGRWDLNRKLTSVNLGMSYTDSDTHATLDHDALPYIDTSQYKSQLENLALGNKILHGNRQDWAGNFGITQILNKNALFSTGLDFTHSNGYLANPYKVVELFFIDPKQTPLNTDVPGLSPLYTATARAALEQRPGVRDQWHWSSQYLHYFPRLDAALKLGYQFYHDSWGINAHTFEADWRQALGESWSITPFLRYYSQNAADFYQPYYLVDQPANSLQRDDQGRLRLTRFDLGKLPYRYYTSDQRLSGYGSLSGGVTFSKKFSRGITLEAGVEYYTHQGKLKLGGGGEGSYVDFDYYTVNAALNVDLSAPFSFPELHHAAAAESPTLAHGHGHAVIPAGVMFGHHLPQAGAFMVGYRYMYSAQDGAILHGARPASDPAVVAGGCDRGACSDVPRHHDMHMHMLDLMYAPTNWLTLMLMPQFVDMSMDLRPLAGVTPDAHGTHGHSTGGVGDTSAFALVSLVNRPHRQLQAGLGISAPTGDVNLSFRRTHQTDSGLVHYGMQLGSGTWDLRPSLTYTGEWERWSWGGQLSGTLRLEHRNREGYALGDNLQATVWGALHLTPWLTTSVRGVYTAQAAIRGQYKRKHETTSPLDFPANYGGQFWDVGFGLNAKVPVGPLKGQHVGIEWLQPVRDDVLGYQLDRTGSLYVTWNILF